MSPTQPWGRGGAGQQRQGHTQHGHPCAPDQAAATCCLSGVSFRTQCLFLVVVCCRYGFDLFQSRWQANLSLFDALGM